MPHREDQGFWRILESQERSNQETLRNSETPGNLTRPKKPISRRANAALRRGGIPGRIMVDEVDEGESNIVPCRWKPGASPAEYSEVCARV